MHRFFVAGDDAKEGTVTISGSDAHHIKNVLRLRPGDTIEVCTDDSTVYICVIESVGESVVTRITDMQRAASELPAKIILFQCLPKKDKMEFVIQKAVELGVYEIIPVISERTIIKLDEKKTVSRTARWNMIAKGAAEQSGRCVIPRVREPVAFEKALEIAKDCSLRIMPYENAEDMDQTRKIIGQIKPDGKVCLMIGPEGGFSGAEADACINAGFEAVTLGKRILRTETAGITALSFIIYSIEN